jgi:hypothetical protein
MLTPILGKMPKTCQFSGAYLVVNLSLGAELPALSILAEQWTLRDFSGIGGIGDQNIQ